MEKYFKDIDILKTKIDFNFDAICAIKRSGWIMGVILSNHFNKPLFTTSEVGNIPKKFNNILLVDDKTCKGKTMRKQLNKLINHNKIVKTASLYIQEDYYTDYWIECKNNISHNRIAIQYML